MTYTICVSRQGLLDCGIPIDAMGFNPDAEAYFLAAADYVGIPDTFQLIEDSMFLVPKSYCAVVGYHRGE